MGSPVSSNKRYVGVGEGSMQLLFNDDLLTTLSRIRWPGKNWKISLLFSNDLGQRISELLHVQNLLPEVRTLLLSEALLGDHLPFLGKGRRNLQFYLWQALGSGFKLMFLDLLAGDGGIAVLKGDLLAEFFWKIVYFRAHCAIDEVLLTLINYHIFAGLSPLRSFLLLLCRFVGLGC